MKQRLLATLALTSFLLTAPLAAVRAAMDHPAIGEGFIPESLPVSDTPYKDGDRIVILDDDRLPVLNRAYPYSTIGRIDWVLANGRSLGACTGTLIGRDLVLTNSHCLQHPRTGDVVNQRQYQRGREKIVFKPAMIRGQAPAEAEVMTFEYGWDDNPDVAAEDWAILKLDRPLGDTFGYLGWRRLDFSDSRVINAVAGKIRIAGYAGDFPTANLREFGEAGDTAGQHDGCSVVDIATALNLNEQVRNQLAGLLFHACDTNPGSSGSALIGHWEDGVYVILGLHAGSNTFRLGDQSLSINRAVRVEQWADQAAQMWQE